MRKRQQPTGLQTALIDKTRDVLLHCLTHGIRVECAFDDRYVLEILPNAFGIGTTSIRIEHSDPRDYSRDVEALFIIVLKATCQDKDAQVASFIAFYMKDADNVEHYLDFLARHAYELRQWLGVLPKYFDEGEIKVLHDNLYEKHSLSKR